MVYTNVLVARMATRGALAIHGKTGSEQQLTVGHRMPGHRIPGHHMPPTTQASRMLMFEAALIENLGSRYTSMRTGKPAAHSAQHT